MVCNTQNYWVFGLCPSSGSGSHYVFLQIIRLILCIGVHGLG
jgi:hypothetical protein